MSDDHGRDRWGLVQVVVGLLGVVATVLVALLATDTIKVVDGGDDETTVVETTVVTPPPAETAPTQPPSPANIPCPSEADEGPLSAVALPIGFCDGAIETANDVDVREFTSPAGGQYSFEVAKGRTGEDSDVISVVFSVDGTTAERNVVASDEPLGVSYSLEAGQAMKIEVSDGCSNSCGIGPYRITVAEL